MMGEHSDWAGGFRRANPEIPEGMCIVCGTDQGIYARARRCSSAIKLTSTDEHGQQKSASLELDTQALLATAREGGFFAYAAGVCYELLTFNQVGGIEIVNYKTDLPLRKGLSSSAALCVLVARAFNVAYGLKYTERGEMELAYKGEISTPSKCGRMDQCCAFGQAPVLMTFDGDHMRCERLTLPPGVTLYYVIVDMLAEKDTTVILSELSRAYPSPSGEGDELAIQKGVHEFLGPTNARLMKAAKDAFLAGDAAKIGAVMKEYQREFDAKLQPACPSQLTAPVLHKTLSLPSLQPHVWAGKGVGSNGDGTAQFLCKSKASQEEVVRLVKEELKMIPLTFTISGSPP